MFSDPEEHFVASQRLQQIQRWAGGEHLVVEEVPYNIRIWRGELLIDGGYGPEQELQGSKST